MNTVKDVIQMKKEPMNPFENKYEWFFLTLEDNSLSKANGLERNLTLIKDYDKEAQEYILHQLFLVNEDAASDLMGALKIQKPFVSDENALHLVQP